MLVKVREVRYLGVGRVAFGSYSSRRAVFHDVGLLCAEWLRFFGRAHGVVICGYLKWLLILVGFNRCCAIVSVF